jgi:hypothetical protein
MIHWQRSQRRLTLSLPYFGLVILAMVQTALSQTAKSSAEIEPIAIIEKLTVRDGMVSGEVVNRSANRLRDVQLFVRYTWLWDDEMKPGTIDPVTSTFYTLTNEKIPAGRLPFTFTPSPPLPKVAGGHFETSVTIAGFSQVIEIAK